MKTIFSFVCFSIFFITTCIFAQVGIGTVTPTTTLEVIGKPADVTIRDGITIPKLTCEQLIAKHSGGATYDIAQTGTIIYITDAVTACIAAAPVTNIANLGTPGFYIFNGTEFEKIADTSSTWTTNGNATTNPTTNFIGTTDMQPLAFRTNNSEKMRLFSLVNPSIGLGRNDLTGVNGGASSYSGPALFFGPSGNISTNTGLDFIIDDDNNATNSRFTFKANGDGTSGTIDLLEIGENGNIGIGTTASPTQILSLNGNSARTINMERNSISDTAGNSLTVLSGAATSGANNKNGGNLNLSSGTATGTGSSDMNFQTATAGTTGTADRSPTTKMTILGNGNVGIGTATPSQRLEVTGSVFANAENSAITIDFGASRLGFVKKSGSVPFIGAGSGQPIVFSHHSSQSNLFGNITGSFNERMRLDANGNLGLGTSAPSQILSLGGNSARTINMERHTTTNTAGNNLTLLAGGATSGAIDKNGGNLFLSSGTGTGTGSSSINFQTVTSGTTGATDRSPTTKMIILGNGNVGIGENNPTSKLHLQGDIRVTGSVLDSNGESGLVGEVLSSTPTGTDWVSVSSASSIEWRRDGNATTTPASNFLGTTDNVDFRIRTNNLERIAITSGGDVGIGTMSPSTALDVVGQIKISGGTPGVGKVLTSDAAGLSTWTLPAVVSADNGVNISSNVLKLGGPLTALTTISGLTATNKLAITGTGVDSFNINGTTFSVDASNSRIGLGTATPSQILSLGGNTARTINMERNTTADTAGNNLTIVSGGATNLATDKNGGNLILSSGTATGTGSSDINFQTATAGTTGTTNRNPSTKMSILGNGNVGIGTTSPAQTLDVSGGNFVLGTTIANPMLNIRSSANSDGSGGFIEFNEVFPNHGYTIRHNTNTGTYGDDGLWFETKNTTYTPAFGYNNAGRVGIGTTTPTSKLHVVGDSSIVGNLGVTGNSSITGTFGVTGNINLNTDTARTTTFGNSTNEDVIIINPVGASGTPISGTITTVNLTSTPKEWTFPDLTGTVVLSSTAPANVPNLYSIDGTVSSNRTITQGTNTVNFSNTATTQSPFTISANSLTTGKALTITTTALTSGSALDITSSNGTSNTNGVIKVANTSGSGAGTFATFQSNSTTGSGITILNNGRVGIGTTAPDQLLSVDGDASKAGGGSWATFSDERVKKNVTNYTKGLKEIMAIRPVSFQYNEKSNYTDQSKVYVGVIAQEIEKILPGTVTKTKTENFDDLRQFNSSELTYTLINAIKELKAREEKSTNDIQELKNMIETMKNEIDLLKQKK